MTDWYLISRQMKLLVRAFWFRNTMCAKHLDCTFIFCVAIVLFYTACSGFPMPSKRKVKPHSVSNKSDLLELKEVTENNSAISIQLQTEHPTTRNRLMGDSHIQSEPLGAQSRGDTISAGRKALSTKVARHSRRNLDVLLQELSEHYYNGDDKKESHNEMLKDIEMSRMVDLGHALAPVFSRLHRRALFRERLPLIFDEHVSIGRARVAKRRATSVGDIDGNGVVDLIVADPLAKNDSGKARLFLMTKGAHYLYSREITPGIADFDGPEVRPGHRYGTAVFRLPGGNATTGSFVAISAPGDGEHGVIHVVKISHKGDILCHAKAQLDGRGSRVSHRPVSMSALGTARPRVQIVRPENLNNTGNVGILSDVERIVFEAPDGEVLATLAIDSADDANLLALVESEYLLSTSLRSIQHSDAFPRFSVKVGIDRAAPITGGCYVNTTHCPCDEPDQKRDGCLSFLRKEVPSGRSVCVHSTCPRRVECQCGGKYICERSDIVSKYYVMEGMLSGPKNEKEEVYCKVHEGSRPEGILQKDGLINSYVKQGSVELFNETHCLCSVKSSTWNGGRCLRYFRTSYGLAVYCVWKPCQIGNREYQCDNLGSAYCRRDVETRSYWSDDGAVVGLTDVVYCHEARGNVEKVSLLFDV